MKCREFERIMTSYINDTLQEDIKKEAESHLHSCKHCSVLTREIGYADQIINEEKKVISNPFLSTRVLAAIDNIEKPLVIMPKPFWQKALQPIMIVSLVTAGIFIGYKTGNLYNSVYQKPTIDESAYFNDVAMESLNFISKEN
jgi:hypothetical protein